MQRLDKIGESAKIMIDIKDVVQSVKQLLKTITTDDRKEILKKFVDRIVATREEVEIHGYIPITTNRKVKLNAINRHSEDLAIPYSITFTMPPRNKRGYSKEFVKNLT